MLRIGIDYRERIGSLSFLPRQGQVSIPAAMTVKISETFLTFETFLDFLKKNMSRVSTQTLLRMSINCGERIGNLSFGFQHENKVDAA